MPSKIGSDAARDLAGASADGDCTAASDVTGNPADTGGFGGCSAFHRIPAAKANASKNGGSALSATDTRDCSAASRAALAGAGVDAARSAGHSAVSNTSAQAAYIASKRACSSGVLQKM